ncbi:MAG TPA: LegC family aminotransferase [Patescibacteria group bacterium]|nr:LegC family aminotransferase [Patescibacteria group bacterium]
MIPLCEPVLAGREWDYVKQCLDSGWVSSVGAFVDRFEAEFAQALSVRHAVAMTSGTAALHIALLVAGVAADDEVLIPALTFIAPANAIRYCNAWPVFVDIDPVTWQIDAAQVRRFLEDDCARVDGVLRNRVSGRRVKALLPVHLLGHPCAMNELAALAETHGLALVEDATESLGARIHGRSVGSFGQSACFSFNGNKLLTTGSGGMLVTDDEAVARRARYLSTQAKDSAEYRHDAIGFNYRLTNVQAAMGCAQLELLTAKLAAKRQIAERYRRELAEPLGLDMLWEAEGCVSALWLSTILLPQGWSAAARGALRQELCDSGIETRPLWLPIPYDPPYAGAQVLGGAVFDDVWTRALSLPSSCNLTTEQQEMVIAAVTLGIERGPAMH